ncbi:unnamed protein product [Strongylus vulgaris]|uniref:Uncharacterized protein n=1 Tax=Strongylus vulgaris TaxID=40348 RepID=A0A3P7LN90_STRVU|nr:unnamed protein product [Strongylus vulgaris]
MALPAVTVHLSRQLIRGRNMIEDTRRGKIRRMADVVEIHTMETAAMHTVPRQVVLEAREDGDHLQVATLQADQHGVDVEAQEVTAGQHLEMVEEHLQVRACVMTMTSINSAFELL